MATLGFFTLDTGGATGGKSGYMRLVVGEGDSGGRGSVTNAKNRIGGSVTVRSGYCLDMDSGQITVGSPKTGFEGVSGYINLFTGTSSAGSSGYVVLNTGGRNSRSWWRH